MDQFASKPGLSGVVEWRREKGSEETHFPVANTSAFGWTGMPYLVASLAVIVICAVHAVWIHSPVFPVDDAYITIHNAQVLAGTPERNFVNTPALAGSTSIVHTLFISLFMHILTPLWAALVAQYVSVLLYALALVRLASIFALRRALMFAVLFIGLLAGNPCYHMLNGLETALTMAALLFTFSLAASRQPSHWMAACCGLIPFLRPELVALSALLLLWLVVQRLGRGVNLPNVRKCLIDVAGFLAVALAFVFILYWNTGQFVPNTISAKQFFFAESSLPPLLKKAWVEGSVRSFVLVLGPVTAAVLFLAWDFLGSLILCFVPIFLGAYYLKFPGALGHYDHRYMYVLVPIVFLGVVQGLASKNKYVCRMAILLLALTGLQHVLTFSKSWHGYWSACEFTRHQLADVANFCNRSFAPDTRLLIHDAGYIAFATPFPLVDLVGLKTPEAVPYERDITYRSGGRERALAISQIALATHPQYLVVLNGWDRIFNISNGLKENGWKLEKVWGEETDTESLSPFDPKYKPHYLVFRISPPATLAIGSMRNP